MLTLWFTKKSLTGSTCKELSDWGLQAMPLVGAGPQKEAMISLLLNLPTAPPVLMNYETLNTNYTALMKLVKRSVVKQERIVVVIDEVHRLRGGANPSGPTKLYKNLKSLLSTIPEKLLWPIFLTGSPINNRVEDVWAYLHLFDEHRFPNLRQFSGMFKAFNGTIKQDVLVKALASNMIRRTKQEVRADLPPLTYKTHSLELPENSEIKRLYNKITQDAILSLASMGEKDVSITSLLAILHYQRLILVSPGAFMYNWRPVDPITMERQETPIRQELRFNGAMPKLDYCMEHGDEILRENPDHGLLIFTSQFNSPLTWLERKFCDLGYTAETIQGSTISTSAVERRFQTGETRVLICNSKSAAEGLNFNRSPKWNGGASEVIFLDRWWNPELNRQARDRIYRIDNLEPVTVHEYHVTKSVDELIQEILDDKAALIEGIVEDKSFRPSVLIEKLEATL